MEGWTEEHYNIYTFIELQQGNRRELSKTEIKDLEVAQKIDEIMESGDPNWLDEVQKYLEEDDLESFNLDDAMFERIDQEQRLRGE